MHHHSLDSLQTKKSLTVDGIDYQYFSFAEAEKSVGSFHRLPYCLKILMENLLRFENDRSVTVEDIKALANWAETRTSQREIAFQPARVLMQDFTGVPAVVDLAAMREAIQSLGGDPQRINPLAPVDLVIDHSVMVDAYGHAEAFRINVEQEYARNRERYLFLKWGQQSFQNFRVVPPGTGICHQVNLEYLGQVVWLSEFAGQQYVYPDTVLGTDSHTTMINGLGILGWGVGGIEAEAAMLGQPVSMLLPEVIGFELTGALREGVTATDLVLTITNMLRAYGVVGKFVEFYGEGLDHLTLADRATISNMAPEYGATCGIFPIDDETLRYLRFTGRDPHRIRLVEAYAKAQGLWRSHNPSPFFTNTLHLDLSKVESTLAGPKRPQDKVLLSAAAHSCETALTKEKNTQRAHVNVAIRGREYQLQDGDIVIAAITSCTNTSNPSVMLGAGLLARNARLRGLQVKPWVKTSLAPGSQVVSDYLHKSGLDKDLDALGFYLVGYGCTTCIGNSGPLLPEIAQAIDQHDLTVAGVLSGNRNFEGRIHPQVKLNYLASPMLVVAYALAGTMRLDLLKEPLGYDQTERPVFLKDIWPSHSDIQKTIESCITPEMFARRYSDVFKGDAHWQSLESTKATTYQWVPQSTYVKLPPFFDKISLKPDGLQDIQNARVLAILGDSITTDHISPAGSIQKSGPAGQYLERHGVKPDDFNSYGARRGNHEVMMRGTFANIRLQNEMVSGITGGFTRLMPEGKTMSIFEAAMEYQSRGVPLVIIAGKEYGTGSSRDWAAKGTRLLGVKAVIAESFERIHRSNLVGVGVLPLEFMPGHDRHSLNLTGEEQITLTGIANGLHPRATIDCHITYKDGRTKVILLGCRIDTLDEIEYYKNGGILHYVLRHLAQAA
jgi:aconitate hydratase